jgi:hypothetical protein
VNASGIGKKRSWLYEGNIPRDFGHRQKIPVRIVSVTAEIRTWHLPNKRQKPLMLEPACSVTSVRAEKFTCGTLYSICSLKTKV